MRATARALRRWTRFAASAALWSSSLLACGGGAEEARPKPSDKVDITTQPAATLDGAPEQLEAESAPDTDGDPGQVEQERAHRVIFADRTSQGYLLLIDKKRIQAAPSRAQLDAWVRAAFPGRADDGEVSVLRKLIRLEAHDDRLAKNPLDFDKPESLVEATRAPGAPDPASGEDFATPDLFGLHIQLFDRDRDPGVLPADAIANPIATRDLSEAQRQSITQRSAILLLRADYRNQYDVRGLRLLQGLVRIVAKEHDALIFDPDTLETRDEVHFTERRLSANLGSVAEQIAVIPFRESDGSVRLATRGMRRFGLPDLELAGLEVDAAQLQRATDMISGLARVLIQEAEVDDSGVAIQAPDEIELSRKDIEMAYKDGGAKLPAVCERCPQRTTVHLMRRPPRDTDAQEHLTVAITAPREQVESAAHDHRKWVRSTLADLFGPPSSPAP